MNVAHSNLSSGKSIIKGSNMFYYDLQSCTLNWAMLFHLLKDNYILLLGKITDSLIYFKFYIGSIRSSSLLLLIYLDICEGLHQPAPS